MESRTDKCDGRETARLPGGSPTAPWWVRAVCLVALAGLLLWFGVTSNRQIRGEKKQDFEYFYQGGASLLNAGGLDPGYDEVDGRVVRRGKLDWYWPIVPRLMSIPALLPQVPAGYVWLGCNLAALLAVLRLVGGRLTGLPPRDWPVTQLVPVLILVTYWLWEFRLNQIDLLTMLLLVGSLATWESGRRAISGFWLGLAVLLKLTPGLLVVWFLLKREYQTVAAAILTVVLAGPVADICALGPARARDAYADWMRRAVTGGSQAALVRSQHEMDWRNQSLGAVLSRWLHETNYSTQFENDPRLAVEYADEPARTVNVVNLPATTVARIVSVVLAASLLGLVWIARRPARKMSRWQIRYEWALFMLAMLWMMPVMRLYHMIWAYPAVALLGAGVHWRGMRAGWSYLTLVCLAGTAAVQFASMNQPVAARGIVLGCVVLLAVPVLLMLRHLARQPEFCQATDTGADDV